MACDAELLSCVHTCVCMTGTCCLQRESAAVSKAWKRVILSYVVVAMLPLAKPLSRVCIQGTLTLFIMNIRLSLHVFSDIDVADCIKMADYTD